jgi:hypothetical protein
VEKLKHEGTKVSKQWAIRGICCKLMKWTTVGEGLWNCWFFGSWIRGGSSYCVEFDVKNGIFRVGMLGPLLWEFRDGWVLRDHSSYQVPRFYWSKGRARRRSWSLVQWH